jgi:DNA-binding transcriptional MerR regulator
MLTIGKLAKAAGVSTPTIRYYEEIGLLPPADRSESGQRVYGAEDLERLTFIRRCRDFGFGIEQVRLLAGLSISADRDCRVRCGSSWPNSRRSNAACNASLPNATLYAAAGREEIASCSRTSLLRHLHRLMNVSFSRFAAECCQPASHPFSDIPSLRHLPR